MSSKNNVARAVFYEGIQGLPTDSPCTLEVSDDSFIIRSSVQPIQVTIPLSDIFSFSCMQEKNFMLKYHNAAAETSKAGVKWYLAVEYKGGMMAFWNGDHAAFKKFLEWQQMPLNMASSNAKSFNNYEASANVQNNPQPTYRTEYSNNSSATQRKKSHKGIGCLTVILIIVFAVIIATVIGSSTSNKDTAENNTSGSDVVIDVNSLYPMTLDEAEKAYGTLTDEGDYDNGQYYIDKSGNHEKWYDTDDGTKIFKFSLDGSKLYGIDFIYDQDQISIENENQLGTILGVQINSGMKKNMTRYYNFDDKGYIKELYVLGDSTTYPLTASEIQIWFN